MSKIAFFVVAAIAAGLFGAPVTTARAEPDAVTSALARLDQLNNQIEQANAQVDAASRKLTQDQAVESSLNTQLAAIARLQYKRPMLLIQLFGAANLSQVMGDINSSQLMADKERHLLLQARDLRRQDVQARDEASIALATLKAGHEEAQKIADAAVATRDAAIRARALAIAQAQAATPAPAAWSGGGQWPNRFAYGYCTWYVANRRYIPWLGNAIDWWPNARPYGYAEGQAPRVGAVMVTRESGYGHVAYVESVNADGSWVVSEMNFVGWNQASSRTVRPGQVPLVGFIY
jgi:surface antigen